MRFFPDLGEGACIDRSFMQVVSKMRDGLGHGGSFQSRSRLAVDLNSQLSLPTLPGGGVYIVEKGSEQHTTAPSTITKEFIVKILCLICLHAQYHSSNATTAISSFFLFMFPNRYYLILMFLSNCS